MRPFGIRTKTLLIFIFCAVIVAGATFVMWQSDTLDFSHTVAAGSHTTSPNLHTIFVSTSGSDSYSGRTPDSAWATISKVNSHAFAAGDSILFKRGDTWREHLLIASSGAAGKPIVYGAYGSRAKPKILGSLDLSSTSHWTNHAGNIWKITRPFSGFSGARGDCSGLWFNNSDNSVGVMQFSLGACVKQGDFNSDPDTDVLYLYSTSNPGSYYSHIEAIAAEEGNGGITGSHIVLQNIEFQYVGGFLIGRDASHDVVVESCDLIRSGAQRFPGKTGTDRAGGGFWVWNGGADIVVRYCYVSQQYDGGISPQGDGSSGYGFKRLYFHHNIIKNCDTGFELWSRGACPMDSLFIENNTLVNAGGWGSTQDQRPQAPNRRPDPNTGLGRADLIDYHMSSATWTHIFIRNNILYQNQPDRCIWMPEDFGTANTASLTSDNNLFYRPKFASPDPGTMIAWYIIPNRTYTQAQFAAYQSETGKDAHSLIGDPLFVSPTDFHLRSNSPARRRGVNRGYTKDFDGNPIAGTPDIGAYEYQN